MANINATSQILILVTTNFMLGAINLQSTDLDGIETRQMATGNIFHGLPKITKCFILNIPMTTY